MNTVKLASVLIALHLFGGAAYAADTTVPADPGKKADPSLDTPVATFQDWAVGLAIVKPKKHGVSDAVIINGTVRANAETSSETMVLVARHFYPWRTSPKCSTDTMLVTFKNCVGAMVGVGLGSSDASGSGQIINFAGVGITIGGSPSTQSTLAWHFGLGVGRRFHMTVLGDGFEVNAPPPTGETQVRYKTIDVNAPFIYFATHW